jgi:hypothetical protein
MKCNKKYKFEKAEISTNGTIIINKINRISTSKNNKKKNKQVKKKITKF